MLRKTREAEKGAEMSSPADALSTIGYVKVGPNV